MQTIPQEILIARIAKKERLSKAIEGLDLSEKAIKSLDWIGNYAEGQTVDSVCEALEKARCLDAKAK